MIELMPKYRFCLGGHDLEMVEIARLLADSGFGAETIDRRLAWGARASAYADEIAEALAQGDTPVLVELADDLAPDLDRRRLINIDHHGERAGADQPSSLRQVFDLIAPVAIHPVVWTRHFELIAANDIGHAKAMRAIGATPKEIRAIRDADRAAQGITAEIEAASRAALDEAKWLAGLMVVHVAAPTSSAVVDFLLPEYDGPGECDVLVVTETTFAFFGQGHVIQALSAMPASWYGGALPERGFWGIPKGTIAPEDLIARISALLHSRRG